MNVFSTDVLPADRKAGAGSELVRCDVARAEIAPGIPADFDGRLQRIALGPMVLTHIRCSAVHIRYAPDVAGRTHDSYLLFMPLDNAFELSLNGRSGVWVNSGELCLVDLAQPHEVIQDDSAHSIFLLFPKRYLETLLPRVAHLAGQVMKADLAASRMLHSLLREVLRECGQSNTAELSHFFCQGILNLIAGVYTERTDAAADPDIRARARAFCDYIDTNLTNPGLRQTDVARHFSVSDRYVRAAMHANGENFSTYVLGKRLNLSRQLLRDPGLQSKSITEISFLSGFNSASHFGRMFKVRFGTSPGRFRRCL